MQGKTKQILYVIKTFILTKVAKFVTQELGIFENYKTKDFNFHFSFILWLIIMGLFFIFQILLASFLILNYIKSTFYT